MIQLLRKYLVSIIVLALLVGAFYWWLESRKFDDSVMANVPEYTDLDQRSFLADDDVRSRLEPSYYKYYDDLVYEGVTDTEGFEVSIPATEYSAASQHGISIENNVGDRPGPALITEEVTGEDVWVEYEVEVPESGFYQIGLTYYALPAKRSSILRNLEVNGEFQFFQTKRMEFQRMWEEAGPTMRDNQGNELNPRQVEVEGWQYRDFRSAESHVSEPFRYYLEAGVNTLRINIMREPAAFGEIKVFSPRVLPTYEEYLEKYRSQGYVEVTDFYKHHQAEDAVLKSDPTLRRMEDREPSTEPFDKYAIALNTFGGWAWRKGGQWAEWEIEVPESGLYNIGVRYGAWYLNGVPTERIFYVNGEIPFQEMNHTRFPYRQAFQMNSVGGPDKDYLFFLEEGTNTIRLEMQIGGLGEIFEIIQDVSYKMALLNREIILFTGTNPDVNRDWNLDRNIPNLIPRLHLMALDLDHAMNLLYDLGVSRNSSQLSLLGMSRNQLIDMAENPDTIPGRLAQFTDTQSSLGLWITSLSEQSLVLDYFVIKSTDQEWPPAEAPVATRAWYAVHDFLLSFTKDYSGIGNIYEGQDVLDVWIARGRDWAQIIKQMTDEDFTPDTGIAVNVNVIPAQAMNLLMLSTTSGLNPDVALGVEGEVPIDFAIRNAIVNLNEFDDYEEVIERFRPGALIPYRFQGGDYALPENQNFNMLFYRTDIMLDLGIEKIPDTWEEVMEIIPILQQHGYDFYYPHAPNNALMAINEYSPFLFQKGGEFYRDDGRVSNLDQPEALEAMQLWTGLYTNYKIDKDANFYNRFRTGEMPIGVADYSTYVLLATAAPELTGWWEMRPMPGIKQEDGQINRSTGGLAQTAMIMKNSDMIDEGWEYLKWWTSADIQERFGEELEALIGVEARWNTANVEALTRLPWPDHDIQAVLEQWEWFQEREIVLGAYYTSRHIGNMWNEIVLNGKNVREAMDDGIKEINRELRKKREEFGLD